MLVPAPLKPHLMSFLGWPVAQGQLGHRCLKALTRSPCLPTMVPGSLSITASEKEGDVCVKYSSSPLGEGKGGSRYIIFRELYYPLLWGHGLGIPGPPDLGCGRASLGSGMGRMGRKGLPRKKDQDGVLGSGCLGLSIPPLLSEVLCRLVFSFLIEISWVKGTREGP